MHFNLVLSNHRAAALQALDDVLRPLLFGLRAAGHRVTAPARQFGKLPAVNLVVEDFGEPGFARLLQDARGTWKDDLLLGVICPAAVDGDGAAARRAGLQTVLRLADFAWTVAPEILPPEWIARERAAVLGYGFHPALAGPRLISEPGARDIDVVVYAADSDRVSRLIQRLTGAKVGHFHLRPGVLPDYLATDLLSRGKVAVAVGDGRGPPRTVLPRIAKALCNGVLVIAEPDSTDAALTAAVVPCPDDGIAAECQAAIASGQYAARGLQGFELFKAMPMTEALAAALALPVFGRAGA